LRDGFITFVKKRKRRLWADVSLSKIQEQDSAE